MEYKGRAQEDERLVYGKNPVAELLKSGSGVDTVFLADTLPPAVAGYYMALAKETGAVAKQVRAAKLRSICGVDSHQGVAAFAASVEYATLDDLLQRAAGRLPSQIHQVADGSLGIGLDAVQTPPDDGLGHAAVHFSVRHIAHLASLLFCLYDKGGGRRGIWTLSPFCSKRKQPRRFM